MKTESSKILGRVVVVDDNATLRTLTTRLLESMGWKVVAQGSTGVEAVDLYEKLRPDLLITDYNMPEMDGMQAVHEIYVKHPRANVILCSSTIDLNHIGHDLPAKTMAVLPKPFSQHGLQEAIKSLQEEGGGQEVR